MPRLPTVSLGAATLLLFSALTGCSVILDVDADQCSNASDCEPLGDDLRCEQGVCVEDEDAENASCPDVSNYVSSNTIAPIRNACELPAQLTARVLTDGANEVEVASGLMPALPFDWCFFGQKASNLWIGDNGYIAFGDSPPGATQALVGDAHSLGGAGVPAPGVSVFWDSLRPGPDGVCLAVDGQPGSQTLWITWSAACFEDGTGVCNADSGSNLTFSVGLEEATGKILVGYLSMSGDGPLEQRALGQSATIGLSDAVTPACTADACSPEGLCTDGTPCGYTEISAQRILDPLPSIEFSPQ